MNWKKLLHPPLWLLTTLVIVCAAALTFIFLKGMEQSIPAYLVYVLSFYTLSAVTLFSVLTLPNRYRALKKRIYDNPLGNRYMTDRAFRTNVSLSASFVFNMLYAGIHVWFWYTLQSYWFLILAVYYAIMTIMRFLLVRYVRIQKIGTSLLGEWKRTRICACMLLLINLSLSGAVLMILYENKGYDYPGILIYVMALYTFYSIAHATVNIIRYHKFGSPVMSTAKIVSLSRALVSVLNLETAMFAQFGTDLSPKNQHIFIILTGAGVSIAIVTLSVILIIHANKEIRRINHGS